MSNPTREGRDDLWSRSLISLLCMQACTVVNDNVFRWLAVGIGKRFVEPKYESAVLAAGALAFVVPYLLLAAPAGYLADRFAKRQVILVCKFAEIVLMVLGVFAIANRSLVSLFTILMLMGAQAALFSPSRLMSLPELLKPSAIPAANGLMGLTTVVASVLGAVIGNWLTDLTSPEGPGGLKLSAMVLIGVAAAGYAISWLMRYVSAANPTLGFPWNAPVQTVRDLRELYRHAGLFRVALGIAFFWSLASLAQLNIDRFAFDSGAFQQSDVAPLLAALAAGVGLGSVLAGIWSQGRVELGIVPLGGLLIAICSMTLFLVPGQLVEPAGATAMASASRVAAGTGGAIAAGTTARAGVGGAAGTGTGTGTGTGAESAANEPSSANSLSASTDKAGETRRGPADPPHHGIYTRSYGLAVVLLLLLGTGAGLFDVPLEAYLQHRSPAVSRGSLLAASNFLTFGGISLSSLLFLAMRAPLRADGSALFTARQIFLVCGVLTIPVCVYIVWRIPQASIRFLVWLASLLVYRIRVHGRDNLPPEGGAVIASNHVSWLDGFLLMMISSRPVRAIAWVGSLENRWVRALADLHGVIPIDPSKPKSVIRALKTAREAVEQGELVAIFPEGGITRTGLTQAFKPGMLRIVEGTKIPVVPVYLDGLWGSLFSFSDGRFFRKRPKAWPYPIDIHFGRPIDTPSDIQQVRQAVLELGSQAVAHRTRAMPIVSRMFIRQAKQRLRGFKIADSLGTEVSGGQTLMRALILRRLLRRHVLASDEKMVGVLLPPSAGGVIANAALALDRRVSVNLNYTVSNDVMNACLKLAGIRHVLTTRKFLERFEFQLDAEIVFLEDLRDKVGLMDKLATAVQTYALPAAAVEASLGLGRVTADDPITVIFTSGSTGTPKGVVLTYGNVGSNVEAIQTVVRLSKQDVLIGILPFFHSFGYTVTLWTVLGLDIAGAYHFNPLDGKQVGKLVEKYRGTVLLSTPTFLRTYLRRCEKVEFQTLDVVVAGAEKLPVDLCEAFEQKFGVRPVEGYGTTELSPLVSVNIPPSRSLGSAQVDRKEGTVGRPIPGVTARITDPETGAIRPVGEAGMLWITGPNVMQGYLHRPDLTDAVIRDGWYMTGDIAVLDEDGFIKITGRESRFSKIGGEMVPHILVEEHLNKIIGVNEEEGLKAIVTAVPDPKKGERLVVIHTAIAPSPETLQQALMAAGLPNIYIPSPDSYFQVDTLPILGSGKLDLKAVRQLALEKTAG
jgi:acyl-[acyl-carrier-protein]-phospholipid O-acyltransferase/long-chain-fatty-acid--[acyl-carrier-protein] ligase